MKNIYAAKLWLLLFLVPASVQAQFTYFTIDGGISITGYSGPGGDLTIPSTINGLPVNGIFSSAFLGKSSLTSVTIPDSVISIGDRAFSYCTSLTNVAIGNSVKT